MHLANMVFGEKTSFRIIFLSTTALANVIILLGTIYRILAPDSDALVTYSYLDRDNPLEMPTGPIPTIEMTFQESIRFGVGGSNDTKANWETLITNQFGIGFAHLGPYHFRFISAAYHSLHCVYSMQEDFDKPNHLTNPSHHFIHCLMYMRQIFLCDADITLEDGDFMTRNLTIDRMGHTRQCRDWTAAAGWLDQNFKEWSDWNGVKWD